MSSESCLRLKARISGLLLVAVIAVLVLLYNYSVSRNVHLKAEFVNINTRTVVQHYYNADSQETHWRKDTGNKPSKRQQLQKKEKSKRHFQTIKKTANNGHYNRKIKHHSRYSNLCGSGWQGKYAQLHRNILSSKQEAKYLAYTCPGYRQGCCGYGNRLRAVVSLFYLAVLTDRAFLIDWRLPEPLEDYLIPKEIQWNSSTPLDLCTGFETRRHYWGTSGADVRQAEGWIIKSSRHFREWFVETNLGEYFDTPVEAISTIWYFVEGGVNKNSYLIKRAKELQITPLLSRGPKYALVGCAFDFLFKTSSAVESHLKFWREFLHKKNGPTIGIHIRTGDQQFDYYASHDPRELNLKNTSMLNGFFRCARKIEKTALSSTNPHNITWFLASDHIKVKDFARKKFPGKVFTTNLTIQHLDILQNTTSNTSFGCNFTTGVNSSALCFNVGEFNKTSFCANRTSFPEYTGILKNNSHQFTDGIIAMLVDHVILSECDFLILCDSSFSSTAVGISMRGLDSYFFGDHDCLNYKQAQQLRKLTYFRRRK